MDLETLVADPGFPLGGGTNLVGVPTPNTATFRKICMSKRKNWDPRGGEGRALDAPLNMDDNDSILN